MKTFNRPFSLTLTSTFLILLAGCGFQLRGSVKIPEWLSPIYISAKNPYSELATELRRQLNSNGIETAETASAGQYTLHIKEISEARRTLAVDSRVDASEFRNEITLVYELTGKAGEIILGPDERISAGRNYQQSADRIESEAGRMDNLRREMYRSIALQVTWRLQSLEQPAENGGTPARQVKQQSLEIGQRSCRTPQTCKKNWKPAWPLFITSVAMSLFCLVKPLTWSGTRPVNRASASAQFFMSKADLTGRNSWHQQTLCHCLLTKHCWNSGCKKPLLRNRVKKP